MSDSQEGLAMDCNCDYATGECQAPIGCKCVADVARLREVNAALLEACKAAIEIADRKLPLFTHREDDCQAVYDQVAAAVARSTGNGRQ